MDKFNLLEDIAKRTAGNIYLGIVGPVRTGKSTFIKRFMDLMVMPHIADEDDRERTKDALPQSGAGRTIMTTEPKFIPDEGVEIAVDNVNFRVRMVDCVGYTVPGALGYSDEDGPRMVLTPWFAEPIPFEEAAEMGTKKVIDEHSTIGLVVTTDGSITDLPRSAYVEAEQRVVAELRALGKPYLVLLNSTDPFSANTMELRATLEEEYDTAVVPIDAMKLTELDIQGILREILYEFPVKEIDVALPAWVDELSGEHWLKKRLGETVKEGIERVQKLRQIDNLLETLSQCDAVSEVTLEAIELGSGQARLALSVPEHLFWEVLSDAAKTEVRGREVLLRLMRDYALVRHEYGKIQDAMSDSRHAGYGIVPPSLDDMELDEPEIIKQGNRFGVRLRARAPAYHFIRVDVEAEVAPIIGTERQSEELVKYLLDEFEANPEKLWDTNIFGKSLHNLVREGIQNKLLRMPDNAQDKLRETLAKIVNEGSGGLIAIIL